MNKNRANILAANHAYRQICLANNRLDDAYSLLTEIRNSLVSNQADNVAINDTTKAMEYIEAMCESLGNIKQRISYVSENLRNA